MKSQNTLSHEKISAHTPLTQPLPPHIPKIHISTAAGLFTAMIVEKIPEKKVRADVLFLPLL